jgi:hypothetical protein
MNNMSSISEGGGSVSILPGVGILGVLGHLNYEPWFALAEFVDNALQSAARSQHELREIDPDFELQVVITYEKDSGGRLVIEDNAAGILRSEFDRAFRAAELPPDRTGLSEFGMGMKSASIWFAKNWRVETTSIGDPNVYVVEFDMHSVLANKVDRLTVTRNDASENSHYTRIDLWNLNQFLPGRTLGKVRDHLREIYREFLREGRLRLNVAGQEMSYSPPQILSAPDFRDVDVDGAGTTATVHEWHKPISFELGDDVVISGWAAIRAEGKTNGNGLSLFRRGRVILGTSDKPFRPPRVYGQPNSYRSQRLFGELTLEGLPVSHTKDGFQWHGREEEFEEKLRAVLDAEPLPLLKQAEGYRARQATRAEFKRIRDAAQNTAEVAERELPAVLSQVVDASHDAGIDQASAVSDQGLELDFTREFSFSQDGRDWTVAISAASRLSESRWLIRHVGSDAKTGSLRVDMTINTAHPFLKQFALGSTDALEAVFRIAVAMVVSESVLHASGDGEVASAFIRQVDAVLSTALSKRLRSDT